MLGTRGQLQRHQTRLDGRYRRLSERGRHLHRLHDAWLSGQVHAVHGPAPRRGCFLRRFWTLRTGDSKSAFDHPAHREQGTSMAPPAFRTNDRISTRALWQWLKLHALCASTFDQCKNRTPFNRIDLMETATIPATEAAPKAGNIVEMSWDPIT